MRGFLRCGCESECCTGSLRAAHRYRTGYPRRVVRILNIPLVARLPLIDEPRRESRFTGFRVLRSAGTKAVASTPSDTFFRPYNQAPKGFESSIGPLTDIARNWKETSAETKKKWEALLQEPKLPRDKVTARVIREVSQRNFAGQMIDLEMEPGVWEKICAPAAKHEWATFASDDCAVL